MSVDGLLLFAFATLLWSLVLAVSNGIAESQAPIDYCSRRYGLPHIQEPTPDLIFKGHDLLDIILVSSVDGKFHALNRTSGHTLWSMASFATTTSLSASSSLSPLVRTTHRRHDADILYYSDDPQHETACPSPSLNWLISRIASVIGEDTKVFVGRKEISILLIELETGRIKATINAECPFIPNEYEDTSIYLDNLERSKPPISNPREVYIERTDYIISIHKKTKPGQSAPPVQELSFSTYAPHDKDDHLQAIYRHTPDDIYLQPLTNGETIAFRMKSSSSEGWNEEDKPLWVHHFSDPIVAIFNVLQPRPLPAPRAPRPHPFVLLQPRRRQDLFPKFSTSGAGTSLRRRSGPMWKKTSGTPAKGNEPNPAEGETDLNHCVVNQNDPRCFVDVRPLDRKALWEVESVITL